MSIHRGLTVVALSVWIALPGLARCASKLGLSGVEVAAQQGPLAAWQSRSTLFAVDSLSCEQLANLTRVALLRFGARKQDLSINTEHCYTRLHSGHIPSVQATFSVLVPISVAAAGPAPAGSAPADAAVAQGPRSTPVIGAGTVQTQWKTVEIRTVSDSLVGKFDRCYQLEQMRNQLLPLFSTRNIKLIPRADCERLRVGLRAEVLKPMPPVGP